ncbi:ribosomal protein N-acetyltransferase [Deinococcus piscis]|uniref:Ribosomal protein N-acetyltransferase n=1 Tax=Deinococcus piscis TaxID=394230 RepID=A0ABQ3K463_9DEIO|nr:GNAT family N-acetyltransferase [Deinococcus piscis]GHF99319.1 ribosomal protein N-acetyltransferase [Deinococcus piscis]
MKPLTVPHELCTARLRLRAPSPADAEASLAAQLASRAELKHWMAWAQEEPTLEQVRANLTAAAERFHSGEELRYHVWDAAGRELIGSSGFHALDWRVPKGEIGYWTATPHTGQGHALEVVQALTTLALTPQGSGGLGFHRLEIRCDPLNGRSRRIPERLGYGLDACLVNDTVSSDGTELRDTLVYSLTR